MNINYKWELFQEATFDYRRMCNFCCAQCALKTTLGRKKAGDSNTRNSKQYNNTCVTHRLSAGWDPFWISCDWKPGPSMMEKRKAANRVPQTHWFIMFPLKPYMGIPGSKQIRVFLEMFGSSLFHNLSPGFVIPARHDWGFNLFGILPLRGHHEIRDILAWWCGSICQGEDPAIKPVLNP